MKSALLHTNLSEEDNLVLEFAEGLPALGVRRAVLSSVVDVSGMEGPVIVAKVDKVLDELRELAGPLRVAGLDVDVRVPTGQIEHELLALAAETHVDVMVSGSHGKSKLDRIVGGSVSETLLSEAECPSLFVRFDLLRNSPRPAWLARDFGRTLVLTTDFSGSANRAFMAVLELPPESVGTLYLLHVMDPLVSESARRRLEDGVEFQLRNLVELAAERGLQARPVIRTGELPRAVLNELNERRATGCVAGTRGRGAFTDALLGGLSVALLRQASCPVMVVP